MQAVMSGWEAVRSTKAKVCSTFPSRSCFVFISTLDTLPNLNPTNFLKGFFWIFFSLFNTASSAAPQSVSEDARIEPRIVTTLEEALSKMSIRVVNLTRWPPHSFIHLFTLALTARHSNHSARSHTWMRSSRVCG
jgi:hypothetical protein